MSSYSAYVDVRTISPGDKHPTIFETFDALMSGTEMEITNDHNPMGLYRELQADREGLFTWNYLEEGPEVWKVAIGKK